MQDMKAVILDISPDVIEDRRRRGIDRLDEVWEGVYHMVPPPSGRHQRLIDELVVILIPYFRRQRLGTLRTIPGVCTWPEPSHNFRVPDLGFVRRGRKRIDDPDSPWLREAPDAVIEVLSPNDESYEKMPFYESIGVIEVVIVNPVSCVVEIHRRTGRKLAEAKPGRDGWLRSKTMSVSFRTRRGPRLEVRLDREGTVVRIGEE